MIRKILLALWGCFFSLCAGFGFIQEPVPIQATAMQLLAVLTFLPPFWLLFLAKKSGNTGDILLIRNLSALSLGLTLLALVLNFLSAFGSETLGQILYYVLIIVSSPMVCSGHWFLSLFLWACLLATSRAHLRR